MVLPVRRKASVVSIDGKVQASGADAPSGSGSGEVQAEVRTYPLGNAGPSTALRSARDDTVIFAP